MKTSKKEGKRSIILRIIALLFLGLYLVLLGIFIYMLFSGSNYVIQMLFVIIVFPVFIYLFVWLKKVFNNEDNSYEKDITDWMKYLHEDE